MESGGVEGIAVLFMLLIQGGACIVSILSLVVWIWALVDCLTKEPSEGNDKVVWALVIVLTGCIGALIYFIVRVPQRKRLQGY
jgi:hypothetical protein